MDPADLRAFAQRDWEEASRAKLRYWREQHLRRGAEATLAASQALWQHMRALQPDWPTARQRDEDLTFHIALKRALDRAANAFPPR